jgi:glycosyltransferase involved in cell wall biosynthesis
MTNSLCGVSEKIMFRKLKICLIGAQHNVNDDRMLYREAKPLSYLYDVTVVGVGKSDCVERKEGITFVSFLRNNRLSHFRLLLKQAAYLRSSSYDIIHCFDLDGLIVTIFATQIRKKRPLIVYDAHEHVPSLMARDYVKLPNSLLPIFESFLNVTELFYASFCAAFVTVNQNLFNRFEVFRKPIIILRNLPELSWFDVDQSPEVLLNTTSPIIIYIGSLGIDKGLLTMIEAKSILERRKIQTSFLIVGRVKDISKDVLVSLGFIVTDWVDPTQIPVYLRRSSIGLALIRPIFLNYTLGEPSKMFVYMAAGLPIIATEFPGTKIVREESCGMLVPFDNPGAVAVCIETLLKNNEMRHELGRNGRKASEKKYNAEIERPKLLQLYKLLSIHYRKRE